VAVFITMSSSYRFPFFSLFRNVHDSIRSMAYLIKSRTK